MRPLILNFFLIVGSVDDQAMPRLRSSSRSSEMLALHRVAMPSLRAECGGCPNRSFHGPEREPPWQVRCEYCKYIAFGSRCCCLCVAEGTAVLRVVCFCEMCPSLSFIHRFCVLRYEIEWLHVWSLWLNQFFLFGCNFTIYSTWSNK
jgi:hypothetical protein